MEITQLSMNVAGIAGSPWGFGSFYGISRVVSHLKILWHFLFFRI